VGPVIHFASINNYMDTGNTASVNYAQEFQEDFFVRMDGNPSGSEFIIQGFEGSARFQVYIRADGFVLIAALDNAGLGLYNFSGNTLPVTDGEVHKISVKCIDTVLGTAGNFDVQILVDDVLDNEVTDIDISANGWNINRILTGDGATGKDYSLYEIRSTLNGTWYFVGRLRKNGDPLQGKFVNMVNGKVFTITNRTGIYPYLGASYRLDEDYP